MKFGDWLVAHGDMVSRLTGVLRAVLTEIPINPQHKAALNADLDKANEFGSILIGLAETATEVVAPHSFTPSFVAPVTTATGQAVLAPAAATFTW